MTPADQSGRIADPASAAAASTAEGIDAVVSHHMVGSRSGVSRFNQILAERLGVPMVSVTGEELASTRCPLLSFKFGELGDDARALEAALERRGDAPIQLFLHDYSGLELEDRLTRAADRVYCGNAEVEHAVASLNQRLVPAWAPGLILDTRPFAPTSISVFSFGMAHKVRTDMFRRLGSLLEASGQSYALYLSHANHEKTTLEDADILHQEMRAIFPANLYFLGNLSDVAVYNHLRSATYFAAFFPDGARANNTSLASAMEHGAVVITNLDEHSPRYLRHMETVIDIDACEELPSDPLVLRRISVAAMEASREVSWDRLAARVREGR